MQTCCEIKMGLIRGREIQDLVERSTGEMCPCRAGRECPLEPFRDGKVHIPKQA